MQTTLHHLLNNNITNPANVINHQTNSNQNHHETPLHGETEVRQEYRATTSRDVQLFLLALRF